MKTVPHHAVSYIYQFHLSGIYCYLKWCLWKKKGFKWHTSPMLNSCDCRQRYVITIIDVGSTKGAVAKKYFEYVALTEEK